MEKPDWFGGSASEYAALLGLANRGLGALKPMSSDQRPTAQQLEDAIQCIADELIQVGFDSPNGVNADGMMLEDLIDSLQDVLEGRGTGQAQ